MSHREPEAREARLPVWAQDALRNLRRDLAEVEKQRNSLFGTDLAEARTVVEADGIPYPMPGRTQRVLFGHQVVRTETHDYTTYLFQAVYRNGHLEVMVRDGKVLVVPQASNVVHLRNEDHFGETRRG